jgi:hypothetical protein
VNNIIERKLEAIVMNNSTPVSNPSLTSSSVSALVVTCEDNNKVNNKRKTILLNHFNILRLISVLYRRLNKYLASRFQKNHASFDKYPITYMNVNTNSYFA